MAEPDYNAMSLLVGKTFCWHELYVPDVKAGVKFYEDVLGFGSTEMDMGEMGSYTMLTREGQPVCGAISTNDPKMDGVPPHWATYVSVDDVDERLKGVQTNGGQVVVPPIDIPSVGRIALISDPQGAHIWLFKPTSS